MSSSDTIRYIRRGGGGKEGRKNNQVGGRPAPPPYIGQPIPRIKPIRMVQGSSTSMTMDQEKARCSTSSRRFDTFGENALETIYDQFKFLDETEEPSTSTTTATTTATQSPSSTRPIMAAPMKKPSSDSISKVTMLYCVLPTLEIIASMVILVSSFLIATNNEEKTSHRQDGAASTSEDVSLSSEVIKNLAFQNALSTVVPCFFQMIAAIFGFWPMFSQTRRRAAQALHCLLNSFVIVLWFNSIYDLFFKISMEHLLKPSVGGGVESDEKYVIDLIIGSITYFATIILPSITISISSVNLINPLIRKFQKSMGSITISIGTLLFSLATTVISIFTAQANLNGPKDLSDNSSLYAYGLKESIVFIFVILSSVFSLIVSSQNNKSMMFTAIIGQSICLIAITSELFTSERISAIFNELKVFTDSGTTIEIGIILLNGCAIATCLLIVIQITIFSFSFSTSTQYPAFLGSAHSLLDNNRNPHLERTAF